MQILSTIKRLCRPAYIYLIISVFSLAAVIYQNAGNTTKYCFGDFACKVSSTSSVLLTHGLYIIFSPGTYIPACAIITHNPIAFIKEDFPQLFVPNNNIPSFFTSILSLRA